jgi:hypothetical protein
MSRDPQCWSPVLPGKTPWDVDSYAWPVEGRRAFSVRKSLRQQFTYSVKALRYIHLEKLKRHLKRCPHVVNDVIHRRSCNDNEHVTHFVGTCVQIISRHFAQTGSWRSKRTWFCRFASIWGHFPLANAIPFDDLKKYWWRVRYRYRVRTGAKPP